MAPITLPQKLVFQSSQGEATVFFRGENGIWLDQLHGMKCSFHEEGTGAAITRGLCVLETSDHRCDAEDFQLIEIRVKECGLDLSWGVGNSLLWRSSWRVQPETGIWSRRDKLKNVTNSFIMIRRCLARIPFAPGRYEVYAQSSNWARENQGHWNEFYGGRLSLSSHAGRTTQIANPYLFVREAGAQRGIAFHILPRGNWVIHVDRTSTVKDEFSPFNVIELGLADNHLQMKLSPGEELDLPEILIQAIPFDQLEAGSASLHRYLLEKYFPPQKIKETAPVVYNTWFDAFDALDVNRLRAQLKTAKGIGCEVFTVDAGWYGRGKGDWHKQVGDWREKLDGAFHGQMRAFAEEVRASGLGFGLWVEPERNSPDAPVVQAHPDWFLPGLGGFFYPDLSQPAVYDYVLTELSRLIDTYQLVWMKVDFNFELDQSDDEFSIYFKHWYRLLDELQAKYPNTFFEGCASGGMRLDLNTLAHFDGHFLSDTVNPNDMLRITQGAMLRLPPGFITRWAVLRQIQDQVLAPGGGNWDHAVISDPNFICHVALPGIFGLSGDLASLSPETQAQLRHHVTFYKSWREFIRGSVCHLLTPICPIDDRSGWVAFQLSNPNRPHEILVFIYRLLDGSTRRSFRIKELDEGRNYTVIDEDAPTAPRAVSGSELLSIGLTVDLPHPNSAAVFIIKI